LLSILLTLWKSSVGAILLLNSICLLSCLSNAPLEMCLNCAISFKALSSSTVWLSFGSLLSCLHTNTPNPGPLGLSLGSGISLPFSFHALSSDRLILSFGSFFKGPKSHAPIFLFGPLGLSYESQKGLAPSYFF
jgi:hypothetical protein